MLFSPVVEIQEVGLLAGNSRQPWDDNQGTFTSQQWKCQHQKIIRPYLQTSSINHHIPWIQTEITARHYMEVPLSVLKSDL
jgi:hypothetical protein